MASTYLTRTQVAGNRQIFTQSFWCKIADTSSTQSLGGAFNDSNNYNYCYLDGGNLKLQWKQSGSVTAALDTNRKFRDTNAFYNIVYAVDTTQSTSADRIKLYVNGVQETSFSTATYPTLNRYTEVNDNGTTYNIGSASSGQNFNGIMSHVHFCDGTALAPTVFGSTDATTGEWKINTSPSFTLGANGYTILKDGNTITDQSSNSNNFTLGGGTLTNTEDCPSNVFATLNVLQGTIASGYTIENGNLSTNGTGSNTWRSLPATLASSSGKFYWEIKVAGFSTGMHFGVQDIDQAIQTNNYAYQYSRAYMYKDDGNKANNNSSTSYGNSFTTNDIIGVALDMDNLKLYFSKNGVFQNSGDPTSGSTGTGAAYTLASGYAYTPMISSYASADKYQCNFGNGFFGTTQISSEGSNASGIGKFEYDVPTGYTALSTKGLNE